MQQKPKVESVVKSTRGFSFKKESEKINGGVNEDEQIANNIRNNLFVRRNTTRNCKIEWPGVLYYGTPFEIQIQGSFSCPKGTF
jgi:hypothetical protein